MSRRCDRCRLTRSCCRNRKPQPTSNARSDYAAERLLLSRSSKAPPDWPAAANPGAQHVPFLAFGSIDFAVDIGCVPSRVASLRARSELDCRSRAASTALDRIEALNRTFNHHRAAEPRRPPDGGAASAIGVCQLAQRARTSVRHVRACSELGRSKFIAATTMCRVGGHASFGSSVCPASRGSPEIPAARLWREKCRDRL